MHIIKVLGSRNLWNHSVSVKKINPFHNKHQFTILQESYCCIFVNKLYWCMILLIEFTMHITSCSKFHQKTITVLKVFGSRNQSRLFAWINVHLFQSKWVLSLCCCLIVFFFFVLFLLFVFNDYIYTYLLAWF